MPTESSRKYYISRPQLVPLRRGSGAAPGGDLAAHVAAADPHTQYTVRKEAEEIAFFLSR